MRQLTDEQKVIGTIFDEGSKTKFREMIVDQLKGKVKEYEDVLCGRKQSPINLDEIKYSENQILRARIQTLEMLIEYPEEAKKYLGVYSVDNNLPK